MAMGIYFWTAIGIGFTLFLGLNLIDQMGKKIPIVELMVTLAGLQWIVGPYLDYNKPFQHFKYYMYVDEPTYMAYAVPIVIAFYIGTLLFRKDESMEGIGERVERLLTNHPKLPYLLVIIGFALPFFNFLVPGSLKFVLFLLGNIKYIGAIYLLFSKSSNRWWVFGGTMLFTAATAIAAGMFHDFLLWGMLTFTFVARELKLSYLSKLSIAGLAVFVALSIQTVKHSYREMVWNKGYSGNKTQLFMNLVSEAWQNGTVLSPAPDNDANVRLNQGWIISAVINHVPLREPYANGATVTEAIKASLLPRFLAPDKKKAGGQENFARFTGFKLNTGTSMGISLAGEGWANYGYWGGILFLFSWGLFIGWFWQKIIVWSEHFPTLLIWSPMLFLQVVKAESELVVVLNHLAKASMLVFGLLWFIKRQWGIRI
jgi:hypothetical protein